MKHFVTDKQASPQQIVDGLNQFGCFAIRGYVKPSLLNFLSEQYEKVFSLDRPLVDPVSFDNGDLYMVAQRTLSKYGDFSAFNELFHSSLIQKLVKDYFEGYLEQSAIEVNELYEVERNTTEGPSKATRLHFDRVASLKMAVYLDDTTLSNGALRVVPGTHGLTRQVARAQLKINNDPLYLKNFVANPEMVSEQAVEGQAGTVVFLDTFCLHGGGWLRGNSHRRAVRGITWAAPLYDKYLTEKGPSGDFENLPLDDLSFYHPVPVPEGIHCDSRNIFRG